MSTATTDFLVLQGGLACGLYNAAHQKRGGVLLPATNKIPPVKFLKRRDAQRAIKRTQRVAERLKGTLVDDWLKFSPLQSGQPYTILPLTLSHQ